MLSPKGSYRDILLTPREAPRIDHGSAVSSARLGSTPRQPLFSGRQEYLPDGQSRSAALSPHSENSHDGHSYGQQQNGSSSGDRSLVSLNNHQQQVSSFEATMQAQQSALVENIVAVQSLGQCRDKLANDASALQAAVARAQAVAAARKAEIEELELLTTALQSSLEISSTKEQSSVGSAAVASARFALLQVMLSSAEALRLPEISRALESEVQTAASSTRRSLASLTCTSRSEISTSRFDTLTDSARNTDERRGDDEDGASSDDSSLESSHTGLTRGEGSASGRGPQGGKQESTSAGGAGSQPGSKVQRPGVTLPPLRLPGTIPALTPSSARISPAAIARLHTIRTKLEVAEAILTTRVSGDGLA